jgi:hypothetical protein
LALDPRHRHHTDGILLVTETFLAVIIIVTATATAIVIINNKYIFTIIVITDQNIVYN